MARDTYKYTIGDAGPKAPAHPRPRRAAGLEGDSPPRLPLQQHLFEKLVRDGVLVSPLRGDEQVHLVEEEPRLAVVELEAEGGDGVLHLLLGDLAVAVLVEEAERLAQLLLLGGGARRVGRLVQQQLELRLVDGLRARGASLVHNVDRLLVGDRVAEVLHHCLELILRYFPVVILVKQVESIQVRAGSSHRGAALAAAAEAAPDESPGGP
mmetsp:Transcript_20446/g.60336  ORF Transcript_20446/g.60336 Transcript_20446/m.60336 type:complete len:210 (-) Transcript_20446:132-761(-)